MLKMVVTDLDGTLLNGLGVTSKVDYETLIQLGREGVVRTIATGRSLYSVNKVINDSFPVDYIIFSSGAGIIRWADKQIIHERHLDDNDTQRMIDEFIRLGLDFMVHDSIPQNHFFYYYSVNNNNPDFNRRLDIYRAFCSPYIPGIGFTKGATQLLAVLPNDPELFSNLSAKFSGIKIIRTTSPLDGCSIWMEIFPNDVSKAYGINWLSSNVINCDIKSVISIGNDFNDLDMLEFTPNSYVVSNAPSELKERFKVAPSNEDNGFSFAVNEALSLLSTGYHE